MERRELCSSCGELGMVLDEIDGILACESCGRVGDQAECEFRGEWQIEVDSGRATVGTLVPDRDGGAMAAKRLMNSRATHSYFRDSSHVKDHNKKETMKKVESVLALLRVPLNQAKQVEHILVRTLDGDWGSGRWVDILVAACVYVVIRQDQLPLSIPEVANTVDSDAVEVGRMYNRVLRKLGITMPSVDAAIFLRRAGSEFSALRKLDKNVTNKIVNQGTLLLRYMQECFIFTGRRPLPIVAAALFLALEANEVVVDFAELAGTLGVGLKVARSRYRECQRALVGFGQILPWGKDITIKSVNRHVPKLLKFMETRAKIEEKKRKREDKLGIVTRGQPSAKTAVGALPYPLSREDRSQTVDQNSLSSDHTRVDKACASAEEERTHEVLCDSELVGHNFDQRVHGNAEQQLSVPIDDFGQVPENHPLNLPQLEERRGPEPGQMICLACNGRGVCSCRDGFAVVVDLWSHHEVNANEDVVSAMPGEAIEDGISVSAPEDSESRHKVARWAALPAAFSANVDARARRLDKINHAKERILKARQVLSHTTQTSSSSDAAVERLTLQQKSRLERSCNKRTLSLDWEDLTIEHLLLSGANEAELETGYYKSLLAKHPMKTDIEANDDATSYVRSKREVEFLLQLQEKENPVDASE